MGGVRGGEAGLERGFADSRLADLYDSVRTCAAQVVSDQARQNLIKEIYNDFFSIAFKDMAAELGIVYTPAEVVDAQLHMVQRESMAASPERRLSRSDF